ncbi:MAG TPA: hypothetical protein VGS01_02660 [Candidatus Limnocylindria bacterium]|jgi:hypothetical protein|nr:hypothetical protein [Candidatus Limnocylindria bacterium]
MPNLLRALVLPTALVGVLAVPTSALGSCVQTSVAERAALADVVAYGTITEIRQTFAPASGVIRFRPERLLKGTLPGEVQVFLGPTKGGAITSVDYEAARRGETHTMYLRASEGGSWQTDACSGSHVGAPTTEESVVFGTGTAPPPTAPPDNVPLAIGALAIAAAALAAALFARGHPGPSTLTTTSP